MEEQDWENGQDQEGALMAAQEAQGARDARDKALLERVAEARRRIWAELCAELTPEQKRRLYRYDMLGYAAQIMRVAEAGMGPMTLAEVWEWLEGVCEEVLLAF